MTEASRYGPHDETTTPVGVNVLVGGMSWGWPDGPTGRLPIREVVPTPEAVRRQRRQLNERAAS